MSERGREACREGGGSSAESSTFPQSGDLTHGSHTFLSPAATAHQHSGRERQEGGREKTGSKQHSYGRQRVCDGLWMWAACGFLTCVCLMQPRTSGEIRRSCVSFVSDSVGDSTELAGTLGESPPPQHPHPPFRVCCADLLHITHSNGFDKHLDRFHTRGGTARLTCRFISTIICHEAHCWKKKWFV